MARESDPTAQHLNSWIAEGTPRGARGIGLTMVPVTRNAPIDLG